MSMRKRAERKIFPGDLCECGRPAEVIKGDSKECRRCDEMERAMAGNLGGPTLKARAHRNVGDWKKREPWIFEPYRFHAPAGFV